MMKTSDLIIYPSRATAEGQSINAPTLSTNHYGTGSLQRVRSSFVGRIIPC